MHKNPSGKVEVDISPKEGDKSYQDNAKRVRNRLQEMGIEAYEIRGGVGIHMSKEDAEIVAPILAEFDIPKENVRNYLNAAIHREPAEKLIKAMGIAKESTKEIELETGQLK